MPYDTLIKNGLVIDGTGAPPRRADVAVAAGKIAEIGQIADGAKRVIDATDCVVAPGLSIRIPITTRKSAGIRRSRRPRGTGSLLW
jgi:N-acyl-D-aspartate/D-glutamate deacylase